MTFQSLTRDSNHSNVGAPRRGRPGSLRFNPSRGIAIIQTDQQLRNLNLENPGFNPSRGIAIIQTRIATAQLTVPFVSIPHAG